MKQLLESQTQIEGVWHTIEESRCEACGLVMTYRLRWNGHETAPSFYATVISETDRATVWLGSDPDFARDCYRQIRDGFVTPCTLQDVVDDLTWEHAQR